MIVASKPMWPKLRSKSAGVIRFAVLSLGITLLAGASPALREAPNPTATPANQLAVSGNACGPAALLNAFRFGNSHWQRASNAVQGSTERERMLGIIRTAGMRPSKHLPGRPRWSRRGVGVADLRDMANEMTAGLYLPQLAEEVFFLQPRETPEQLLRHCHRRLESSLAKGLPPILSIRRHALRNQPSGSSEWVIIDAHFVTLTSLPRKLEKSATSFPVTYIDPWGGKPSQGTIRIPANPLLADANGRSSCLEADFPQASVGKKLVRKGEKSAIVLAAAIGRW
jgi:hypothetical protein